MKSRLYSPDVINKKQICGTILLRDIEAPVVGVPVATLVQLAALGSGSHSPFPMHVDELGPTSVSPVLQVNVMTSPSEAGSSYPTIMKSAVITAPGS